MLYVVSVPIGNLQDITLRGLEVLRSVDAIIAEDTREAGKLIQLLNLPKKQFISYREQNHHSAWERIRTELLDGKSLALISDRGTPGVSDPGYRLIREVVAAELDLEVIPGVTAAISALTLSALPSDKFIFLGFLPREQGKQQKLLQKFTDTTIIVYESPFRVVKLLELLQKLWGDDLQVAALTELTKLHQKAYRGSVSEVLADISKTKPKGEWVVVIDARNIV